MKTTHQINEIAHNWNEGSHYFAIRSLCDALIGITEHLETRMFDPDIRGEMARIQEGKMIRRMAMIEALERIEGVYQSHGAARAMALVDSILARLRAGGDL